MLRCMKVFGVLRWPSIMLTRNSRRTSLHLTLNRRRKSMTAFLRFLFLGALLALPVVCFGQQISPVGETGPIRASAACSEILLRRTELQADLEALSADYT